MQYASRHLKALLNILQRFLCLIIKNNFKSSYGILKHKVNVKINIKVLTTGNNSFYRLKLVSTRRKRRLMNGKYGNEGRKWKCVICVIVTDKFRTNLELFPFLCFLLHTSHFTKILNSFSIPNKPDNHSASQPAARPMLNAYNKFSKTWCQS